jgi:predicted GNAT family N-acyltransferase
MSGTNDAISIMFAHVLFDGPQYKQALDLRERVLRLPLGIPLRDEDTRDDATEHTLVALMGERVIACLMLKRADATTMKLRQMAVESEFQKSGVGSALVRYAEDWARSEGVKTIMMDARAAVTPFYEKLGYARDGAPFTSVGIPHQKMHKSLAP